MRAMWTVIGLAGLAACSSPSETSTAGAGGSASGIVASLKWDAENACALLSDDTIGAALGTKVASHKLEPGSERTDSRAGFSTCFYTLENGDQVGFLTRQSPDADNTPEAMAKTRAETAELMGPVEDVAGLGKTAFWVPKLRQVVVFLGEDRYFNLNLPANLNGKDPKTLALALAAKVK